MGTGNIEAIKALKAISTDFHLKGNPGQVQNMSQAWQASSTNSELVHYTSKGPSAAHRVGVVRSEHEDIIGVHLELLNCK